jgi:hypothetical protein
MPSSKSGVLPRLWLLRIDNGKPLCLRGREQSRIGADDRVNGAPFSQIQSNGELETIERAKPLARLRSVQTEKPLCFLVMGNQQAGHRKHSSSRVR